MPAKGDPDLLVDASVAVALVVADHGQHLATTEAIGDRRLGLAGHAAFETFSVLTRLPPPTRRTPDVVHRLLSSNFPYSRYLGADAARSLWDELAGYGIAGGSVCDALVGAAAREHDLTLATLDRRARDVYRALDVRVEFVLSG